MLLVQLVLFTQLVLQLLFLVFVLILKFQLSQLLRLLQLLLPFLYPLTHHTDQSNRPGFFAGFWLNAHSMTWTLTHPCSSDDAAPAESWSGRVSSTDVLRYTSTIPDWPALADKTIALTPPGTIVDWKLLLRDPQPIWTSPQGRVVTMGDAAHPMLPTSGNGATQTVEDATSLATCLALGLDRGATLHDAAKVYNLLRFQRVSFIQAMGLINRNQRTKKGKGGGGAAGMAFGEWVVRHDPEQYAMQRFEEAWECVKGGRETEFVQTSGVPRRPYVPWTIDGVREAERLGEETILDGDWS